MYKHQEIKEKAKKEVTLFNISNKSPNCGAFILINFFKNICYQ
jgi:hypothetical protein